MADVAPLAVVIEERTTMARSRVVLEDELRTLKTALRAIVDLYDDGQLLVDMPASHNRLNQAIEHARPHINRPRKTKS